MRRLLWFLPLILCSAAHAAIARDGNCSAATTNCTLSAVSTGDLVLTFAYRNASTTAPSLPASNTTVFASSGGTTNSFRVYCRIASSSGDTGTGTATNATGIVSVAYSGTPTTTTANCATQAIALGVVGAANAQTATGATSATYSGLTTSSGTTSSWIVGFMGDTVSTDDCTPTGMTIVGSLAGNTQVADTNAAVATWSQKTCSITSATYRTFTVEVLAADSGAGSGTPSVIQVGNDCDWAPYSYGATSNAAGTTFQINLPNPSLAGNMLTLIGSIDSPGTLPTITDDKGNSWFVAESHTDATNSEISFIMYAPNAQAGTQQITTTLNSTNANSSLPCAAEWTNVALSNAFDVGNGNNSTSATSVTAGSSTPTVTGDLVLQYAWNEEVNVLAGAGIGVHFTAGSQTNITWAKFVDGWVWANGAQWGVYASTSALNPTFTVSTGGFNTVSSFFKSSSSGTPMPSGIRVVARHQIPTFGLTPYATNPITSYTPCPSSANLIVADWGGPNEDMTAVSSSGNTWTQTHAKFCDAGPNTCTHNYYAAAATSTPAMSTTITISANSDDSVYLYCIKGAASSPYDTTVTGTGNQSVAGNNTWLSTMSPTTSNGLVTLNGSQEFNTTKSFTTGQLYQGCFFSTENTDRDGCAANNAWGLFYNPNTSAETWTSNFIVGGTAIQVWAAQADAFKAASTSGAAKGRALIF